MDTLTGDVFLAVVCVEVEDVGFGAFLECASSRVFIGRRAGWKRVCTKLHGRSKASRKSFCRGAM